MAKGFIAKNSHIIANSSPVRKVKGATFYTLNTLGGLAIAGQIARIPGVTDLASDLEMKINTFPGADTASELTAAVGAVTLLGVSSKLIKRSRKRRDFAYKHLGGKKLSGKKSLLSGLRRTAVNASIATAAGGLALAASDSSLEMVAALNDSVNNAVTYFNDGVGRAYEALFNTDTGLGAVPKVIGGLTATAIAAGLHSRWSARKHGPIQKRYHVDGYMPTLRGFAWDNIALFLSKASFGLYKSGKHLIARTDMRVTAGITVYDKRSGKKNPGGRILFDPGQEPEKTRSDLTDEDVNLIKSMLKDKATLIDADAKVYGRDVEALAKEGKLYEALRDHYRQHKDRHAPSTLDVQSIIEVLASEQHKDTQISELGSSTILNERKRTPQFTKGGRFYRSLMAHDAGGSLVELTNLRENTDMTVAQSRREYGRNFLKRNKVLVALVFRAMRGADHHGGSAEEDFGDDNAEEIMEMGEQELDALEQQFQSDFATNRVTEIRKAANLYAQFGLGDMLVLQYHAGAYIIERDWLSSIPLPFTNGGLRKRYYVTNSSGEIVAKIAETWPTAISPTGKIVGNNNRNVDIYDSDLAKSDSFGSLLCALSEFLVGKKKYVRNRTLDLQGRDFGGYEATT